MVGFDIAVAIPFAARAGVQLNESDASLDQSTRQQTLASVDFGFFLIESILFLNVFRLLVDVDRVRGVGLHSGRKLVAMNPGFQLGIRFASGMVPVIQLIDEIDFALLEALGDPSGLIQVPEGLGACFEQDPLVPRGHEAGSPGTCSVDNHCRAVFHHHKGRQAFGFRAETVGHPGSQ